MNINPGLTLLGRRLALRPALTARAISRISDAGTRRITPSPALENRTAKLRSIRNVAGNAIPPFSLAFSTPQLVITSRELSESTGKSSWPGAVSKRTVATAAQRRSARQGFTLRVSLHRDRQDRSIVIMQIGRS